MISQEKLEILARFGDSDTRDIREELLNLRLLVAKYVVAHRGTDTHYSADEETLAFVALAQAVEL